MLKGRFAESFLEFALLSFIASFFLTLGSDFPSQMLVRMWFGGVLLLVSVVSLRSQIWSDSLKTIHSLAALFFTSFLLFEMLRFLWAVWQIFVRGMPNSFTLPLYQYVLSPLQWSFYLGSFALSFLMFRKRDQIHRLLWVLGWCGFFLALNAVPPLLIKGHAGYTGGDGQFGFFIPLLYFHEIIPQYLLGRFAHINYTGDVIALGFFPTLGLFFYALHQWRKKREEKRRVDSLGLLGTFSATMALAIILFLSRGTILSFLAAFSLYLIALLLKFPSRTQFKFTAAVFVVTLSYLVCAGSLQKVWKEVQTVQGEFDEAKISSFDTNREGARRALVLYQINPLWGVGTDGYGQVSKHYAPPGTEVFGLVDNVALCHYLQLLAEEGIGAYLYFLFVMAYLVEIVKGLFRTKSRFQFMAGLSLFAAVLMVLIHASINQLMQRFSISMLIYILMGASLGILSRDFDHNPSPIPADA